MQLNPFYNQDHIFPHLWSFRPLRFEFEIRFYSPNKQTRSFSIFKQEFLSACKLFCLLNYKFLHQVCKIKLNKSIFVQKGHVYTIFTSFSSWFQPCSCWDDIKAKNRGQPGLRHPTPSPPSCFSNNHRAFEPFITAETGDRAWPRVPLYIETFIPGEVCSWKILKSEANRDIKKFN